MWMRLMNPDAVHVEVLHVDDDRHALRVSREVACVIRGQQATRALTDEVDLVPTRLGEDAAIAIVACSGPLLFVNADRAPAVGNWQGVTEVEILHAQAVS